MNRLLRALRAAWRWLTDEYDAVHESQGGEGR